MARKRRSVVQPGRKKNTNAIGARDTLYFHAASDRVLFAATGVLVVAGVLMIASAGVVYAGVRFGDSYFFFKRQLLGVVLGFITLLVLSRIDYHVYRRWAMMIYVAGLALLVAVLIPGVGITTYGASRWINLGSLPTFQPSEAMKLALVLYVAAWCSGKGARMLRSVDGGTLPFLGIVAMPAFLVYLQPNLGTVIILAFISVGIFYLAGADMKHIVAIAAGGMIMVLMLIAVAPYRMERFKSFIDPMADPQGSGYQIQQALIAVGSGGMFGVGLGHSRQKGLYLPEPVGDSIFAIIAEETGFVGAMVLIALFVIVAWRGMIIAGGAPDLFGTLVAGGITIWLTGQAMMNIAAITSLMPLTGIPLPFISYGGTSIIFSLAAVGILLNISRQARHA